MKKKSLILCNAIKSGLKVKIVVFQFRTGAYNLEKYPANAI